MAAYSARKMSLPRFQCSVVFVFASVFASVVAFSNDESLLFDVELKNIYFRGASAGHAQIGYFNPFQPQRILCFDHSWTSCFSVCKSPCENALGSMLPAVANEGLVQMKPVQIAQRVRQSVVVPRRRGYCFDFFVHICSTPSGLSIPGQTPPSCAYMNFQSKRVHDRPPANQPPQDAVFRMISSHEDMLAFYGHFFLQHVVIDPAWVKKHFGKANVGKYLQPTVRQLFHESACGGGHAVPL